MIRAFVLSVFLLTSVAQAQDAGVAAPPAVVAGVVDAGVLAPATLPDGGVVDLGTVPIGTALDNPAIFIKYIYQGAKSGDWTTSIAAFLVLLISAFKMFGRKLHDMIPDSSPLDKPFYFLLETKPGGWLTNIAFALGLGAGSALITDGHVTWALMKPTITVVLSSAAIWGAIKDFMEWRKASAAAAPPVAPPAPPPAVPPAPASPAPTKPAGS